MNTATDSPPRQSVPFWTGAMLICLCAYALTLAAGRPLEPLWDEPIDLNIARALRADPLRGERPPLDASQMRLPMYVTAAAFAMSGRDDLAVARHVSAVAAGLTVLAAAGLGRCLFGPVAGLIAAAFLALSPYFLAFARVAMTEGDIFYALTTTLAIWAYVRYRAATTRARWMTLGVAIGLAIGAKLFALVLWPVIVLCELGPASRAGREARVPLSSQLRSLIGLALVSCATVALLMPVHALEPDVARAIIRRILRWDDRVPLALWDDHLRLYAGVLLIKGTWPMGLLSVAALLYAGVREAVDARWRAAIMTVLFSIVAFCFLPLRQTFYLMGAYPLVAVLMGGFVCELHARLSRQASADEKHGTAALGCENPARASIAHVSDRDSRIEPPPQIRGRAPSGRALAAAWTLLVAAAFAWLALETVRAFPHYHLYGHRLVGARWLGAESRGYRNLIQTNSDGVQELMRWCRDHAPAGARVVSYLWEDHMIADEPRIRLTRRGIRLDQSAPPPPPPIDDADYVLLHVNNVLGYGDLPPDTPPMDVLAREFQVVHRVVRDGMEVGWVYSRAADGTGDERKWAN